MKLAQQAAILLALLPTRTNNFSKYTGYNAMDLTNPSDPPPDYITAARAHGIPLRQSAPIKKGPYPLELPILSYLRGKRVILASASPRRKALLTQVGQPPTHTTVQ
jgi:threonyl-tRNA synthetase